MTRTKQNDAKDRASTRRLLPLIAIGGGLAAAPAAALELGDATVQSNLGQPLRASIAYALAPNEMLSSTCVSVSSGQPSGGLPGIGKSTVSITESAIVITGQSALREPMIGARVTINCPYTPNLSREYLLFVDPAPVAEARVAAAAAASTVAQQPVAERRPARRATGATTPIAPASRYRIQPGDTVSSIVLRVTNRTMSLWPAVNTIFAANPDAFINQDPNRLKAGSWLSIPSLDGTAPVVAEVAEPAPAIDMPAVAKTEPATTVYEPVDPIAPIVVNVTARETAAAPVMPSTTSAPVVTTTVISTGARNESTSLLAWLVGGGLAILGALVLFGRRLRKGTTTASRATPATAAQPELVDDVVEEFADYDIEDDSPTEENLALDANLEIGSGFDTGVDVEVAEDFAFAATTELDIELPIESEPTRDAGTDIIPPVNMNVESILESEVLPEDDDYDMSVIVDATKMPQPEDATEHDLKAVEVAADDGTLISDNYTISREVDYDILEQDYEDELSATQALNQEIERAAAELARDLEDEADDEATAELDASFDPNDTNAVTVNMSHDDKTSELPVANDDETAEMEVSGGKVQKKA